MASTIGTWAVKLVADSSGLISGFNKASTLTQNFAKQGRGVAAVAAGGITSAVGSLTRLNLGQQTSQFGGMAAAAFGLGIALATMNPLAIAAGVGALGVQVAHYTHNVMEAINATKDISELTGIAFHEASGFESLSRRAGVDPAGAVPSLRLYMIQLGKLRDELQGGASGPMTRALGSMGINAQLFSRARIPEQFAAIAQSIQGMPEGEQTAALAQILGRRGLAMAEFFRKNDPAQIRDMGGLARSQGVSITGDEAELIEGTIKSFRVLQDVTATTFSTIGHSFAIGIAPVMKYFAESGAMVVGASAPLIRSIGAALVFISSIAFSPIIAAMAVGLTGARILLPALMSLGRLFERLGEGMYRTVVGLAPLGAAVVGLFTGMDLGINDLAGWIDNLTDFAVIFVLQVGTVFSEFIAETARLLRSAISLYMQAAVAVSTASGGMIDTTGADVRLNSIREGLREIEEGALRSVAALESQGVAAAAAQQLRDRDKLVRMSQAAIGMAGGIVGAMNGPIFGSAGFSTMADGIHKSNLEIGRSREEIEQLRATQEGYSVSQLAGLRIRQRERTVLEEMNQMEQRNLQNKERLLNGLQSPYQKYLDQLQQINEAGLQPDARLRAIGQAFLGLEQSLPKTPDRSPAAMLSSAVSGQRLLMEQQQRDARSNVDPQERVRRALEAAQKTHIEQREIQRRIAVAVESMSGVAVVGQ